MMEILRLAVTGAKRNGRRFGMYGEEPANYPEIAAALVGWGSTPSVSTPQARSAP